MTEQNEKRILKNTFDMTLSGLKTDPYLAQKIIRSQTKGEEKVKKKISFALILANALVLIAITAFAVSIGTENPDKQELQPAVTLSPVELDGEKLYDIIPLSQACDIARDAIRTYYGVTDEEMEQLLLYPYDAMNTDGTGQWTMVFYSNLNRIFDQSQDPYAGPLGEYRVVLNAVTGDVELCEWYTTDFWKNARRIWAAGNYDEVYLHYFADDFQSLPKEEQAYFTSLLKEKGYAVQADSSRHSLLRTFRAHILLCDPDTALPEDDPQAQAAWQALKDRNGLDITILQSYSFIATRAPWESDTDDIVIAYNIPSAVTKHAFGEMDPCSWFLYPQVQRIGMFLISFEKDTTHIVNRIRLDYEAPVAEDAVETDHGLLLNRYLKWNNNELLKFHESFLHLEQMMDEMDEKNATDYEMVAAASAYMIELGSGNEIYYNNNGMALPYGRTAFQVGREWMLATAAPGEAYATLRQDHYGILVKDLQTELRNQGFYSGVADGYYDEETTEAVKAFQRQNSLDEDGVAGPATQRLLFEDVN